MQVFELGGDVVAPSLAHGLMRLIAEGAGEGDESADAELRAQAAAAYMQLLSKPKLPNILIKVFLCLCFMLISVLAALNISVLLFFPRACCGRATQKHASFSSLAAHAITFAGNLGTTNHAEICYVGGVSP